MYHAKVLGLAEHIRFVGIVLEASKLQYAKVLVWEEHIHSVGIPLEGNKLLWEKVELGRLSRGAGIALETG